MSAARQGGRWWNTTLVLESLIPALTCVEAADAELANYDEACDAAIAYLWEALRLLESALPSEGQRGRRVVTGVDNVLAKLTGVKRRLGRGWEARCPAHDDNRPEPLRRSQGRQGVALLPRGLRDPGNLTAAGLTAVDLFRHAPSRHRPPWRPTRIAMSWASCSTRQCVSSRRTSGSSPEWVGWRHVEPSRRAGSCTDCPSCERRSSVAPLYGSWRPRRTPTRSLLTARPLRPTSVALGSGAP